MTALPFVKIYGSILTSSVWTESAATRIVWLTLLALADAEGLVRASVSGLAHMANVTRGECDHALAVLTGPDSDSRTKEDEGRRIEALDGGWLVLNYTRYRELRTEDQLAAAAKKRRQRHGDVSPIRGDMSPDTRDTSRDNRGDGEGDGEGELDPVPDSDLAELTELERIFLQRFYPRANEARVADVRAQLRATLTPTGAQIRRDQFAKAVSVAHLKRCIASILRGEPPKSPKVAVVWVLREVERTRLEFLSEVNRETTVRNRAVTIGPTRIGDEGLATVSTPQ